MCARECARARVSVRVCVCRRRAPDSGRPIRHRENQEARGHALLSPSRVRVRTPREEGVGGGMQEQYWDQMTARSDSPVSRNADHETTRPLHCGAAGGGGNGRFARERSLVARSLEAVERFETLHRINTMDFV